MVEHFLGKKGVVGSIPAIGSKRQQLIIELVVMKKEFIVRLQCTECKHINYYTRRNKKTVERKLELKKYCSWCRKHTVHKEIKK